MALLAAIQVLQPCDFKIDRQVSGRGPLRNDPRNCQTFLSAFKVFDHALAIQQSLHRVPRHEGFALRYTGNARRRSRNPNLFCAQRRNSSIARWAPVLARFIRQEWCEANS